MSNKKQPNKPAEPKVEEKTPETMAAAPEKKDAPKPPVEAYCVMGFLAAPGETVAPGEVIELSDADFRRLKYAGKVIDAKDAPTTPDPEPEAE